MDALIQAENVSVVRQGKPILQDISMVVVPGDFITIVGPNGAGKSMLLKCLMGFYKPDKGTIVCKKNLRIGYVPQSFVPEPTMPITVERFLRLRKKTDTESIRQVAQETNIEPVLTQPLTVLSGGEVQRVLLARSLLNNPELLVLDEPEQNLDVSSQLTFYKLLEKVYAQRKVSILMVSHDLHIVMALTRQVICLFHHICCSGEPHAVTQDPKFISLFGKDMVKLMAVYQHSHNRIHHRNRA